MDLMFHVSTAAGGQLLAPLALAAQRAGCSFGAFFTHEGVLGLKDDSLLAALEPAARIVVCDESWRHFCAGLPCPGEARGQTINSAMMGLAGKVVSL